MLINKIREIHAAQPGVFESMCEELLLRIPDDKQVISLVFYGDPVDNNEYHRQLGILHDKADRYFHSSPPLAYIAQKPLQGGLLLEVCLAWDNQCQVSHQQFSGIRYATIQNDSCKELVIAGVMADDQAAGIFQQASAVFAMIGTILSREGMPVDSIVRQWNYIENITGLTSGTQNYHAFNRARSHFYDPAGWENGYPAATGIGTRAGGIIVRLEALRCFTREIRNIPVNNELQVPAHRYSPQVINGNDCTAGTPKFERARFIISAGQGYALISGTAAIRGEKSMASGDAIGQTRITMENIFNLLPGQEKPRFEVCIVYLKNESDYPAVQQYMKTQFPDVSPAFLLADLCRDELLVEIEAIWRIT
jgi:enamine deaminase RidA (YjgF/YER057c/UK114 family)